MYILGYIPKDNKLYLSDKDMNVVGYSLLLSVLEYQTAVMRQDFETAKQVYVHFLAVLYVGDTLFTANCVRLSLNARRSARNPKHCAESSRRPNTQSRQWLEALT